MPDLPLFPPTSTLTKTRYTGLIISSRNSSLNTQNPSTLPSSKHLFGDCDRSLVAHRVTSPTSTATIPTSDFTSFTTDSQPTWSSTPLTQAASAQFTPQHSFNQDFQLFATPPPPAPNQSQHGQAIPRIAPNHQINYSPRHSTLTVSPQQPQHQSILGHSNLSNNYNSLTNPNAQLQHYQRIIARHNLKVRPPVPKFADNPQFPRRRIYSTPTSTKGNMSMSSDDFGGVYHDGNSFDFDLDSNFALFESPQQAHAATVSPADLCSFDSVTSAPASVAFPALNTPGSDYLTSPDLSSGVDTTPVFDLDAGSNFAGMPLFPDSEQFEADPIIVPNDSYTSLADFHHGASASAQASPMVRQKSSPGRPPICHDRKASLSAGISKANQKNRKDLPDIVVEEDDDNQTAKRKKNTAAARKSRQRKLDQLSAMSSEISRLRKMVEILGGNPDDDYVI